MHNEGRRVILLSRVKKSYQAKDHPEAQVTLSLWAYKTVEVGKCMAKGGKT